MLRNNGESLNVCHVSLQHASSVTMVTVVIANAGAPVDAHVIT